MDGDILSDDELSDISDDDDGEQDVNGKRGGEGTGGGRMEKRLSRRRRGKGQILKK